MRSLIFFILLLIFSASLHANTAHTITNLSSSSIHFFALTYQPNSRFPYKQGRWFTILPGETLVCEKHNIANFDEQDPRKVSLKFGTTIVDHEWAEHILSFLKAAYDIYIYCYTEKTKYFGDYNIKLIASFVPPELLDVDELCQAEQQSTAINNRRTLAEYKAQYTTY